MRISEHAQPVYRYGTHYLDFKDGATEARIDVLTLGLAETKKRMEEQVLPTSSKAQGYRAFVEAVEKARKEQEGGE